MVQKKLCRNVLAAPDSTLILPLCNGIFCSQQWNPTSNYEVPLGKPKETRVGFYTVVKAVLFYFILFCFVLFVFLGPHLGHMEGPRLGVQSEPWPLAYTTATAMWDLSHVCDLHHSSWQLWILNPLSEARDQTRVLMDASQVC